MAICSNCGALLHDDDRMEHVCRQEDLPRKGITKVNGVQFDNKTKLVIA